MRALLGVSMTAIVVLALAMRVVGLEGTNEAASSSSVSSSLSSSTESLASRPEFGSRNESWLELQKWLMYAYSAYCTEVKRVWGDAAMTLVIEWRLRQLTTSESIEFDELE